MRKSCTMFILFVDNKFKTTLEQLYIYIVGLVGFNLLAANKYSSLVRTVNVII
jgi:hypothetical protein